MTPELVDALRSMLVWYGEVAPEDAGLVQIGEPKGVEKQCATF